MSEIDAARHLEERRPSWDIQLERGRRGYVGPPKLLLKLITAETVEHVEVVSLDDGKLTFNGDQEGCEYPGDTAVSVRQILQGRDTAWQVQTPQPPEGGTARVEVRSTIGEAKWVNVFEVKLPAAPPRVYSF